MFAVTLALAVRAEAVPIETRQTGLGNALGGRTVFVPFVSASADARAFRVVRCAPAFRLVQLLAVAAPFHFFLVLRTIGTEVFLAPDATERVSDLGVANFVTATMTAHLFSKSDWMAECMTGLVRQSAGSGDTLCVTHISEEVRKNK